MFDSFLCRRLLLSVLNLLDKTNKKIRLSLIIFVFDFAPFKLYMHVSRRLFVNPWSAHISGQRTVVEMIDQLVAKKVIQPDPKQRAMADLCSPLLEAVEQHQSLKEIRDRRLLEEANKNAVLRRAKLLFQAMAKRWKAIDRISRAVDVQWPEVLAPNEPSSGLYIWGDVGIGKTMVLDLFELCPTPSYLGKRRTHIHSFMTSISNRLVDVEREVAEGKRPRDLRRPIEIVVDKIVQETPILCFDEFQTFDVAHAALLSTFFTLALEKGIFLMTTSNRPPQELFHLSSTFGGFLPLLFRHCNVVHCTGITDYRRVAAAQGSCHDYVFLYPNNQHTAEQLMQRVFRALPQGAAWVEGAALHLYGRSTIIPRSCGGVAVFQFSEICGKEQMLGPQDFQLLAKTFHTIVVLNVPQIGSVSKNAAKQFIIMVDELYQYRVKLLLTSSCRWERLMENDGLASAVDTDFTAYSDGADERSGSTYEAASSLLSNEEVLSFGRVASRLQEMGSQSYLLADHVDFTITDFNMTKLME